jgi:hypothetical protein
MRLLVRWQAVYVLLPAMLLEGATPQPPQVRGRLRVDGLERIEEGVLFLIQALLHAHLSPCFAVCRY